MLQQTETARYYVVHLPEANKRLLEASQSETFISKSLRNEKPSNPLTLVQVFRKTSVSALSVFLVFMMTFMIFPGLTASTRSFQPNVLDSGRFVQILFVGFGFFLF